MSGTPRLLVVGVGNPDRGDDGIGPLVVRQLVGRVSPDVAIVERGGDALALIDDWAGRDAVILVDAAAPGSAPGSVHRIDLLKDALPPEVSLSSTHAFGVAEAAGLADALGLLPAHMIAYAIEGANFDPGAPISPAVAAAAGDVVELVAAELRELVRNGSSALRQDGMSIDRGPASAPRHGEVEPGHDDDETGHCSIDTSHDTAPTRIPPHA